MSVYALRRDFLLVAELVKILHAEISPKACRKRGIGLLRRQYAQLADPSSTPAERVLAEICRNCPLACELARKE